MKTFESNYLFLVVLGGRADKANVELHDVRWVVGSKIEDTFNVLRKNWFGTIDGLHIDSFKKIEYIDGYKIYLKNFESEKENFMNLARIGSLSFIDQSWKNHLSEMDYLRSGIGLRAMGQRDPLVEYQKEGYDLFEELIDNVKLSVVRLLLNFEKVSQDNKKFEKKESKKVNFDSKSKIGRNDPCHCGSGLKYKKCGMVDKCSKSSQTN